MGRILAFTVIGLVFLVLLGFLSVGYFAVGYFVLLAIPAALAAIFVTSRHVHPVVAALLGTAVTFGIIFGLIFPLLAIKAIQGDFDNTAYCDGFCMTNGQGFVLATIILLFLAAPTSLAGGVISFFAAIVTPRRSRAA